MSNNRPDRNDFIEVFPQNIELDALYNFDVDNGNLVPILGPYDLDSIMHYPPLAFSRNFEPTMAARDGRKDFGISTGGLGGVQTTLSKLDIEKLAVLYQNR